VFAHACKMGLEGIVSKRKGSTYCSGRSPDWLKSKNPACEAVKRGLGQMTGKMQVKKTWQLAEQHGLWWAYEGDLPPPEAFQTHSRPRHLPILGPYPCRAVAEALLRRHLDRRRD
jgi:hypothetical protein